MALSQLRQDGEQPFFDGRRVECGEEDDQGAARGRPEGAGGEASRVGLHQLRLQGRHGVDQGRQDVARCAALDQGAYLSVVGEEVDAVAGARGQGGQEQSRVHGGVEARCVAHAACRRAAGVEDEQDVPVAFGAPGAYGDGGLAGGRAPVDGTGVVAGDVLAQTVELRALAAGEDAGAAVEFAEAGQLGGQVLAAGERGQNADRPRHPVGALAGEEAEWTVRADRDAVGLAVTATGGAQAGGDSSAFAGGHRQGVTGGRRLRAGLPAAGRPGVAEPGP